MAQTPEGYKFPINLSFVDTYVVSVQINFRQGQRQSSLCRAQERKQMIMEKMMNTKTERNTFTKKIGKTVYIVRYYFNEEAKENMQEKINRMLVTEASRQEIQLGEVT